MFFLFGEGNVCMNPWPKCIFTKWLCLLCRSCAELLLLLPQHVPGALWEEFQTSMKVSIIRVVKIPSPEAYLCIIGNGKSLRNQWQQWFCRLSLQKSLLLSYLTHFYLLSQLAHGLLQESGSTQLRLLSFLAQQDGVWSNATLSGILSNQIPLVEQGQHFLVITDVIIRNLTCVEKITSHIVSCLSVQFMSILS